MIRIEFRANLQVSCGKLVAKDQSGVEVHAATYLRDGLIILDRALLRNKAELHRIFLHELFHFVWWRLGNPRRKAWEHLLTREFSRRARGELGWSAEWRKEKLVPEDRRRRTRAWREYCCESFCDSGASYLCRGRHPEQTLAPAFRKLRNQWLGDIIQSEEDLVSIVNPKSRWSGFSWPAGFNGLRAVPHRQRPIAQVLERP